jgi:DNA (cytosine-5)-methyltransferase 1
MAGLKVIWGMDFNTSAGETWAKNFSTAKLYNMWAHELVALPGPDDLFIVDILHLSPPCQVFSPVHTIKGKDDDMNYASLFAIMELIKKTKPRIVTLEQTFGILHKRFRQAFNTVIHMYTALGFSVSWQIVELQRLGLAQRRKRLIIVASWYEMPYISSATTLTNFKPRREASRFPTFHSFREWHRWTQAVCHTPRIAFTHTS